MKNQGESANLFRKTSIFRHIFSKIYHKTVTKARESAGRGKSTATEERKNRRESKTKPPQKQGETAIKARKNTPIDPRPTPQKTAYFTNCLQFPASPPSDRSRKTPHHPPSNPRPTRQDARVRPVKIPASDPSRYPRPTRQDAQAILKGAHRPAISTSPRPTRYKRTIHRPTRRHKRSAHPHRPHTIPLIPYTSPLAPHTANLALPRAPRTLEHTARPPTSPHRPPVPCATPPHTRSPPSFLAPPTIPCPPPTPRTLHCLSPRAPLHRPAHRTATPSRPAHAPKISSDSTRSLPA